MRISRWSQILHAGFGLYVIVSMGAQVELFRRYLALIGTDAAQIWTPFQWLLAEGGAVSSMSLPGILWLDTLLFMIPFGFSLFLLVEDCFTLRSVVLVTAVYAGVLNAVNYWIIAPVFNVDFVIASLCGSCLGYLLSLGCVNLFATRQIASFLAVPKPFKKAA